MWEGRCNKGIPLAYIPMVGFIMETFGDLGEILVSFVWGLEMGIAPLLIVADSNLFIGHSLLVLWVLTFFTIA